ncbi:MAG: hypothetical protein K2Q33_08870 [Gammaproteobacteria bacterium]|nr:hypothetical protein [Gammaproteobacteria bacterium]
MAYSSSSVARSLLLTYFEKDDKEMAVTLLRNHESVYVEALANMRDLDVLGFYKKILPSVDEGPYPVHLIKLQCRLLKQAIMAVNMPCLKIFFGDSSFHHYINQEPEIRSGFYLSLNYHYMHIQKCQPSDYARKVYVNLQDEEASLDVKADVITFLKKYCDMPAKRRAAAPCVSLDENVTLAHTLPSSEPVDATILLEGHCKVSSSVTGSEPLTPESTLASMAGSTASPTRSRAWDESLCSTLFSRSASPISHRCSPYHSPLRPDVERPRSPGVT